MSKVQDRVARIMEQYGQGQISAIETIVLISQVLFLSEAELKERNKIPT